MSKLKKWWKPTLIVLLIAVAVLAIVQMERELRGGTDPRGLLAGTVTAITQNDAGETELTLQVTSDYWYTVALDDSVKCYADPDKKKEISAAEIGVGDFVDGRYRLFDKNRVKWIYVI